MRSRLRIILWLAAAMLFVTACSSTTVVARDDRAIAADPAPDSADAGDRAVGDGTDDGDPPLSGTEADTALVEGFGLGGAEQLAGLLADCEAANDLACDILYQISEFNSTEETVALTCGGRSDTQVLFCTEGIHSLADQFAFDITSEGLDQIVTACEDDGDMTACDFLFFRSPLESDLEEVGASCGGRVEVAIPDCRTLFGE